MSNYEDDQSEDGELARSPVPQEEMDFSLSEEDIDTNDSLDIRPPQAQIISSRVPKDDRKNRHSGKSERHKEHSHRDKKHAFRERDKPDVRTKKENDVIRHSDREMAYHVKEHPREREYARDKEVYREKPVYRDREKEIYREADPYREKEPYLPKEVYREREKEAYISKEPYREKDREREKDAYISKEPYREKDREREKEAYITKEPYREKDREREKDAYVPKEPYREKDREREKESYISKEAFREKEREKDAYISKEPYREREREKEAYISKEPLREKDRDRERERYMEVERSKERKEVRSRHASSDEASSGRHRGSAGQGDRGGAQGDKELEDLRSRLLSKRRSKEQQQDRRREDSTERRGDSYRAAHLQRRDKLLHTEREMERRKEEGRAALEERRSRRAKRPPSPAPVPPSPAPLQHPSPPPAKRPRPSTSPPEVVTVSDASDHEEQEEGEHTGTSSDSSSGSGESEGDTASGEGEESAEEDEASGAGRPGEEERNAHRASSGEEDGRREVSPNRSPASIHSDTPKRRSRSRSRSHSFSPPSASNGIEDVNSSRQDGGDMEGEGSSPPPHPSPPAGSPQPPLPPYYPALQGCRSVEEFQCLNRIEEGTYGVVYRARDKTTEEIVALKRLKMEKEKEGFPITSLREINTLLKGQHPNIVTVREIVVGSNMDKIFIVMDYVEHDLKGLMETMRARKQVFLPGEVKCLMQQLLRAVDHLHDNWILHRDLKTSNLLLSHKGILKVGDFGLAREYGSPLKSYTPVVVTLWYRAPELLLGARTYSTPIDMWSVGCIFSEFITMQALFPGKSEVDQLNRIFKDLGTPNETVWPGWSQLSGARAQWAEQAGGGLRARVGPGLSEAGLQLLQGLLTYEPSKRLASTKSLQHTFFKEMPQAIDPAMFPTWPAKSEGGRKQHSPRPPAGGDLYNKLMGGDEVSGFHMGAPSAPQPFLPPPTSFSLKF